MRVYFSPTFLSSYFKAPQAVRQSFQNRLPIFMHHPKDPSLNLRRFSEEFAAYYAFRVTPNWHAVVHRAEHGIVVFDTLMRRTELYAEEQMIERWW